MAGVTNNNTPPTANTNRDQNELTQQKSGRAIAFYQNNLELSDPRQFQINRPQKIGSSSTRSALLYGRTTQLSITLQQQLAALDPSQFRITVNPSLYPPPPTRRDFLPTDIPNLTLWLDVFDSSTLTLSGTTLTGWRDKSSNLSLTINSAAQYSATGFPGGLPCLQFSQGNHMTVNLPTLIGNTATLFCVFNVNNNANVNSVPVGSLYYIGSYSSGGLSIFWRGDFNTYNFFQQGAGGTGNSYYTTNNVPMVSSQIMNTSSPFWRVFTNGYNNVNPNLGGYNTPPLTNVGITQAVIGGGIWAQNTGYYAGQFCEFLVYPAALTLAQIQQIEGYLAWKWKLEGSLNPTHPYKFEKPQILV